MSSIVRAVVSFLLLATWSSAQTAPRTYMYDAAGNRSSVVNQIRLDAAAGLFVEPERAMVGERMNLYGRNFPAGQPGQVAVVLGGQAATVLAVGDRVITVEVPAGVATGPITLALQGGAPVAIGTVYVHGVALAPDLVDIDYGQQQQFVATVVGAVNSAVTWSVSDLAGSTVGVGTISTGGLYTAPPLSSTPVSAILVRARNAELGITGHALVRISCVDRGPIANRVLVSDSLPAGNARVCYQFTAAALQRAYVACLGATSIRYLALRNPDGVLVAWAGPGNRLRLPDVVLGSAGTYRVEVQGPAAAVASLQLWVDVHAPLPRGVWMFPGDDSWHTAANWSNGTLPATGDSVVVPDFAGIALRVGVNQSLSVRGLQCEEGLRLTAGNLTLGDTVNPPPFTVRGGIEISGGALQGTATVTCDGASLWTAGSMTGTGRLVIAPTGTLALQANTTVMDLNREVEVQGAATWTSGVLRMANGTLRTPGTFIVNSASTLNCDGNVGANAWVNTGTVRKLGNGVLVVLGGSAGVVCQGNGAWDIQAGRMSLNSNSALAAGTVVSGAGVFEIGGGNTAFAGAISVPGNLTVSGGVASFDGVTTVTGAFRLEAGSVGGAGTLALGGPGTWTGGAMIGSGQTIVGASGTLALQSATTVMDLNRVLEVQGAATWTSGLLRMTGGTLRTPGTFTASTAATLNCAGNAGSNAWLNTGTVRKLGVGIVSVAGGSVGVACQGGGTWDVQAGRFVINSSSALTAGLTVTGAGALEVGGGTTTFTGAGSVTGNLIVSGGAAQVDGALAVSGGFRLEAGSVTGAGTLLVNGAGVWTGGAMAGTGQTVIGGLGTLALQSATTVMDLNRVLEVQGTATWSSGTLRLTNGTLRTPGLFVATTTATLNCSGNAGVNAWDNTGTVRKQGVGTVVVAGGTPGVACGGGGTWDVQVGRIVINSTGTLTSGAVIAGAGALEIGGGATTLTGASTVTGNLIVSGGLAAFDGTTTVTPAGTLRLEAGTAGGSGTLRVDGSGTWTGGAMAGSGSTVIGATGSLALQASTTVMDLNRVLEVQGTAAWTSGTLRMTDGTLRTPGTFTANTTATLSCAGNAGSNVWDNSGTVRKLGAGTVSVVGGTVGVSCRGGGTWDVQVGRIVINSTGTLTNGASITGAGALEIGGGTTTFTGASSVLGNLVLSGGTAAFDGTTVVAAAGNLRLESGSAAGTGTLQIDGTGTWVGGAMAGTGSTVIGGAGALAMQSTTTVMDLNRVLEVQGAATWVSGTLRMNSGTLRNLGTFTAAPTATISCTGNSGTNLWTNQGVLRKQGVGTLSLVGGSVGPLLTNTGTLEVLAGTLAVSRPFTQTAGATRMQGGALSVSSGLALAGGVLEGAGAITGAVTNAAIVRPGGAGAPGLLSITGTYAQTAAGTLEIDVGGTSVGTQYDRLAVSGTATFAGSLAVALFGGFTPAPPQTFDIVTHATGSSGSLTCINCSPTFTLTHLATAARLVAQ